jgi:peptidyl-prolyl cis-trans isomerase SurA
MVRRPKGDGASCRARVAEESSCVSKVVLSALLILSMLPAVSSSSDLTGDERVLATVNGERVTISDYRRFLLKVDPSPASDGIDERLLKKMVEEKLILQEAARLGILVSDEEVEKGVRDFLRENNLTESEFERQIGERGKNLSDYKKWLKENIIVLAKVIGREVNEKVVVGEREERDYYERHRDRYREGQGRIQLKAIRLGFQGTPSPAQATYLEIRAAKIDEDLNRGVPFEKLAALYSDDPARKVGGAFGSFHEGELAPAVEKKLLQVREGGVSEPLWLHDGLYIFKLIKRQGERFSRFESVRDDVRLMLLKQKREERYSAWIKSLWSKSDIEIKMQ